MCMKNLIIDTEVHVLQPSVIEGNFADRYPEEPTVKAIHKHAEYSKVINLLPLSSLLDSMNDNKIDLSIIMGMPWRDFGLQKENNNYIEECVTKYPTHFKALYIPNLNCIKTANKEIEALDNSKFIGVKMLPKDQGRNMLDPELFPFYETLVARKFPLMLHVEHITQSAATDSPFYLLQLAIKFPKLKIIAAHMGGLLALYGLMPKYKDVISKIHFITSVSATMEFVEFGVKVNPKNICFGTDFPFNHSHSQKQVLDKIKSLDLDQSTQFDILGGNATNFYGLS